MQDDDDALSPGIDERDGVEVLPHSIDEPGESGGWGEGAAAGAAGGPEAAPHSIDLAAWQPPAPPAGLADKVIARLREPVAVAAIDAPVAAAAKPSRRARWIVGLSVVAAGAAAIAAATLPGASHSADPDERDIIAVRPRHIAVGASGASSADLDTGAELHLARDGTRTTVHQRRGSVRWTVAAGEALVIDTGGPSPAPTIEASGASLRVEVQMNLSDARLLGASAIMAATVALVTVVVYEGHVKATSGGQSIQIEPGSSVELWPDRPPRELRERAEQAMREAEDARREAMEGLAKLKAREEAEQATLAVDEDKRKADELAAATKAKEDELRKQSEPTPPGFCDGIDVDDVMAQSAAQYSDGYATVALALVKKALRCRQDARMYRFATMYACAAHDVQAARTLFSRVPAAFQPNLEQRCLHDGVSLWPRIEGTERADASPRR
jgi:hypothetical protein